MGADIHIYAEQKLSNGAWAMVKEFRSQAYTVFDVKPKHNDYDRLFPRISGRNYEFFAALAGVRGVGPDPRGMPTDVSPYVEEAADDWDNDGHSHSWYTASEFAPIFIRHCLNEEEIADVMRKRLDQLGPDVISRVIENYIGIRVPGEFEDEGPQLDKLRFVFWFDN